jgi:hypothetical protein
LLHKKIIAPLLKTEIALSDKKKINFFALFIPAMLGKGFAILNEKKMTTHQRKTMMLISAATPLFDDFFDDENLSIQHLKNIFIQRKDFIPTNNKEKLFFEFWIKIYDKSNQQEKLINLSLAIIDAQIKGLQQITMPLQYHEIKEISFAKCSQSTLLFWFLMNDNATIEQLEVVERLGRLIQFSDDVLDMWFDLQTKTKTVATNCITITQLKNDWMQEWQLFEAAVNKLSIIKKNKTTFIQLQYFLLSVTEIAFMQLENLPHATTHFVVSNFNRKQLVCDMELGKNRWRWLKNFTSKKY